MIGQMTGTEARDLLCRRNLGRIGCCEGGNPYVAPVNYFCDGENIYWHSLPGRKKEKGFQTEALSY